MKEEHSEDITMNVGEKYNIYLDLDDHFYEMYSCKLLSGILPKGLDWSWSAEGAHIYGTPTEEGDFVLRFKCVRGDDESTFYHTVNLHVQTPWVNPFVDVSESDWFYKDVKYAYLHGLMYGIDDTHFGPKRPTTRGMIVAVLYRMTGSPTISSTCPFTDVKAGSYYEKAIIWASQNGIVYGVGNNKFAPDTNITREQMAAFLCRYAKYLDVYDEDDCATLAGFADSSKVASWAEASMSWAVGAGMISGSAEKDGVYLMPQGNATRCQAAAILHRFLVQFD